MGGEMRRVGLEERAGKEMGEGPEESSVRWLRAGRCCVFGKGAELPVGGEESDPIVGGKVREFVSCGSKKMRSVVFDEGEEGAEMREEESEVEMIAEWSELGVARFWWSEIEKERFLERDDFGVEGEDFCGGRVRRGEGFDAAKLGFVVAG